MFMKPIKPQPSPEQKDADRHAWAMLQRARPAVDWNKSTLKRADLIGEDVCRVMIGHDDDRNVWVGIVRPGREGPSNPQVFGVASPATLAFCTVEDHAPAGLDGHRPRKGKRALAVGTDGAAPTLLYWHSALRRFVSHVPAAR